MSIVKEIHIYWNIHSESYNEVNELIVGLPKFNSNLFLEYFRITFKTSLVNYQIVFFIRLHMFFVHMLQVYLVHVHTLYILISVFG